MPAPEARSILRRVGLVLVISGLADLGWTIFQAIQTRSFSYDFTLFIAAIAVLTGSLTAADFVRRIAAFGLGGLAVFTPYWLISEPPSLLWARLRLDTVATIETMATTLLLAVLAAWTLRELSREPVMVDAANRPWAWVNAPRAFAGGVTLCLVLGVILLPLAYGKTGDRARLNAEAKLGSSFEYHLETLSVTSDSSGRHISAIVAAWNDSAVVELPVAWDE
jgi:hypothetical protein